MKVHNLTFYIVVLLLSGLVLNLSFSGYWNILHGPKYFAIAEGIIKYGELKSNIFAIPRPEDIFTTQIGVSFIILPSIIIFGQKFWFIGLIFAILFSWKLAFNQTEKFLQSFKIFNKLDIFLIILFFFVQPYNLNQIAAFSNQSIYIPLLIFSFFKILEIFDSKKIDLNSYFFIFIFFLFLGAFFRVHHFVFLFSIFFFFLFFLNKKFIKISIIILPIILILNFLITKYSGLNESIEHIYKFINVIINSFLNENIQNIREGDRFSNPPKDLFWLFKINDSLNIYSFFLFIPKFTNNLVISFLINFLCFLIFLFIIFKNFQNFKQKKFFIFSFIFLICSNFFLFILPMFELSYLLPTNFVIILNYYLFLKKFTGKYFYKTIFSIFISFAFILTLFYTGILESKFIESHKSRKVIKLFIKDFEKIDHSNSLVYFISNKPTYPELHYWFNKKNSICNFDLEFKQCAKLKNITNVKKIHIIISDTEGKLLNLQELKKSNFIIEEITQNFIHMKRKE